MTGRLLETKLHVPKRRRAVVERARLSGRLALVRESALTLVSAPAGFGKSTLVTEWVARAPSDGCTTAWLSLDHRDNDPGLYWQYLVAALQTAAPGVGAGALTLLESGQPTETVVGALLNDLHPIPHDVVLVLDDYHVIEADEVQEGMAFLLEHLPPQVHLVITSRADPALPLHRLRARGDLVELRAADLRFTPEEALAYLNGVMGLALTEQDVATLEQRTEGWIAALQLAALSMQGRDDIAGFIRDFTGDDRYIVDYLLGEVLQAQAGDVRDFLLETSVLGRLSGSLCDAMTARPGGQATLEALERANLFLVPLDDRRHWFRYHYLFADVLRARLLDEAPDRVQELHRRASDWYEEQGDRPEAIRHAMAGEDFDRAADLVERALPSTRQSRQEALLRSWLEALPESVFRVRPVLSLAFAGALMGTGEVEGVEARLRDAERWLDPGIDGRPAPSAEPVVVDPEGFRALPGSVAMFRAGQARLLGDLQGTITHARRALELAREQDVLERGGAAALLGLAYWASGGLDAAHHWYAQGMAALEKAGYQADAVAGAITLADLLIARGRLGDAMRMYEGGLRRATDAAPPGLRGAADMHVGIAELLRERNDLDGARQHLLAAEELGPHVAFPQYPYRWRVATARLRQAEGDLPAAVDLLDEAERFYDTDFSPEVQPVAAVRARVHVALGRVDHALQWAGERRLSPADDLSYVREYEHLTLARLMLAQRTAVDSEGAGQLLARLLDGARRGQRARSVIEILALQALAHQAQENRPAALAALEQALVSAEPEGYVRLFLDEGPPMVALLRDAEAHGVARSHARRVLASESPDHARRDRPDTLVEPLSERELDVLRLLRTELSGPEIAGELMVSVNTMRTHTKSIYAKLGVNSRRAAVRRAAELDL